MNREILKFILKLKGLSPEKMAAYAKLNTSFYSHFYGEYDTDDYDSLPLLTKYDLIGKSPYSLLSSKYKNKVEIYGETSGSSGASTPSFYTRNEFEGFAKLSNLSAFITQMIKDCKANMVAVNGLTFGYTVAGFTFGKMLQQKGFLVAQVGSRSTIALPARNAATIVKLKPSIIAATPLDFMYWMAIIRSKSERDYLDVLKNLKYLMSTAEPCAVSRQRQISKFFNIQHINTYASVDGLVSFDCPCGEKHIVDEILHTSLYDKDKRLVGNYGTGRLCFTNKVKMSTPMVKYLLDDLVTIKESKCSLGYRKSIIPHGRYELSMDINNTTLGSIDFEEVIYEFGLFMDYRVEIFDDRVEIILEEFHLGNAGDSKKLIANALEILTGLKCNITRVHLGALSKYEDVRSEKSILKVKDSRTISRQNIPSIL